MHYLIFKCRFCDLWMILFAFFYFICGRLGKDVKDEWGTLGVFEVDEVVVEVRGHERERGGRHHVLRKTSMASIGATVTYHPSYFLSLYFFFLSLSLSLSFSLTLRFPRFSFIAPSKHLDIPADLG